MLKKFLKYRTPLGVIAILFLTVLIVTACYRLQPLARWTNRLIPRTPINVTALPIGTINKPEPIIRTGSIEKPAAVPITSEVSGQISEVYVTEGQLVTAGQPLVKILGSSEPSSDNGTAASANQSEPPNQQSQTSYENALKEYNRYQKLYEQGAIPRRQVDNAAALLQSLESSSAHNSGTSDSTTPAVSNGFTTINAPVYGTVAGLAAAIGNPVQLGQQLLLLNNNEVRVVIDIEQQDLNLVSLGTSATIEVSGQTLLGQVVSIYPEMGANNIPAFHTHIKITNDTNSLLKPGMPVNVCINTGKSATVPAVPATAIFQDSQGLNYIYLADNGTAIRQQISLGETLGDFIEVTTALPEQTMVITSDVSNIKDGYAIAVSE